MNRVEYMRELRQRLGELKSGEREGVLSFYEEYFDEAGADLEQDVIRDLGSPASLASRILADYAIKAARAAPYNPKKGFSALWAVVLALFAAPFALPVIIVLFALGVAVIATIGALGIAAFAIILGGVGVFFGGFLELLTTPASALILFGIAFLLWGFGKIVFVILGAVLGLLGYLSSFIFGKPNAGRAGGYSDGRSGGYSGSHKGDFHAR